MRIFYSPSSDPMLFGPGADLNALYTCLSEFLASSEKAISVPAEVTLSPAQYQQFLPGLRLKKTQDAVFLCLAEDGWLELCGSVPNLSKYVSHFRFDPSNKDGHHHPDNANHMAASSLRLIIEADATWGEENAGYSKRS